MLRFMDTYQMHICDHLFILGQAGLASSILLVSSICCGVVNRNIRLGDGVELRLVAVEWKDLVSAWEPGMVQHLLRLLLQSAIVDSSMCAHAGDA